MGFIKRLVDSEYKELRKFEKIANQIDALEEEYSKLSDKELQHKTIEFREELEKGKTLDDIIVPAFATVREAAYRVIGEKPFHVQLLGGLALHYGNIAEMKTGEGKTLTATLPVYLNALEGKGVHIVTVNEFLAERDSKWMGEIYRFLGLTVGLNLREMSNKEKQEAYNCDVLYSTNNEIGFDYLRDNMVVRKEDRVQRPLNYCIVDEVDSILIDEARTPLIISGGKFDSKNLYKEADRAVKKLNKEDYDVDVKTKNVSLTEEGTKKLEKEFHLDNLYDIKNSVLVHHINQALKANYGFKLDVDYVIEDGAIIIVDPFTGRLMHGRQYSEGLHQAIEAKEGVTINEETRTMATITFQNLFRMYNKLSGMTGTAKTEEEEFVHIYNMYVIQIPTNRPVARQDLTDLLYSTEKGKFEAIIRVIKEVHKSGQPILVGTISVEKNELLSSLLKKEKLPHEVLNAKNHAREAEIISHAGEKGAITIATNMAGRGTDIKLGEGVKELGGLYVIGTERHESRRIDNQLRGRSGRQGDPGTSQFFVSFDDDLMRRFGTDKVKNALISVGLPEDEAIRSKMFTRSVESAQKKVEGNNYDTRKSLLDYDNVMNQQREIVYRRRNELIDSDNVHKLVFEVFENTIADLIDGHIAPEGYLTEHDIEDILEVVNNNFLRFSKLTEDDLDKKDPNQVIDLIVDRVKEDYEKKLEGIPEVVVNEFEKAISLRVIDAAWVEHISTMEQLKEGIGLRGYAQSNPLTAYTEEGFDIFDKMQQDIDRTITTFLLRTVIDQTVQRKQTIGEGNQIKENEGKKEPVKSKKIGRNELCYCGSGKKYKQCHGKK
ncbi:MAG: preprotein translocase subunit SecA [Firmicutes bacterium]|nr:preprotein translocase subunit SecA [Bacillota bacterium]